MARLDGQRLVDLMLSIIRVVDQNRIGREEFRDTFLRLIGITPNTVESQQLALSGDASPRTQQQILEQTSANATGSQGGQTLIDGFLKSSDENVAQLRQVAGGYVSSLLRIVNRWDKVQRTQQIRRLQRLVGEQDLGVTDTEAQISLDEIANSASEPTSHEKPQGADGVNRTNSAIAETIKNINTALNRIKSSELRGTVGELALKDNFFQLLLAQLTALVASIPSNRMGELSGAFVRSVREPTAGIENSARSIRRQRRAVEVELRLLQEQAQLIVEGILLDGEQQPISLKQILQAFSVITNDITYRCSECKFFDNSGGTPRCIFALENQRGRETQPENSCDEVWGLPNNDYWTASQETIQKVLEALEPSEQDQ